jgi:hypothetical protein
MMYYGSPLSAGTTCPKNKTVIQKTNKLASHHTIAGIYMTTWFYVKTTDNPKTVADTVCAYNYATGEHPEDKYTWQTEQKNDESGEYWEIKSKYSLLKDTVTIGVAYRTGDTVVLSEIDDELAPNFLDPLLEKYGFDNIKWIVTPKR